MGNIALLFLFLCHFLFFSYLLSFNRLERKRLGAQTVPVAEEVDALALALCTFARLNPLAPACALPQSSEEAQRATLGVRAVVLAHDTLDGLASLIGMVEGDGRNVVVEHVGLDDAVEKGAADESEFAVDGSSGATDVVPALGGVVREGWVGVLEVGNRNCCGGLFSKSRLAKRTNDSELGIWEDLPNQWLTQRYGAKYQTAMLVNP